MRRALAAVAAVALLASACSSGGGAKPRRVTVFAAASLQTAFDLIGREFERADPGVTVRFSFGPSDGLAQQIQQGAPADVFASASATWMDAVARNPGASNRADFARNRLTVVVPRSNPAHVHSVRDLAKPGVKLVLAAPGVPAGDYARQILANAGIKHAALSNLVSNEIDVRGVLQKVESGDADAGIVYVTDVRTARSDAIRSIPVPAGLNVLATYPIAIVRGASDIADARAFVRFVLGPGQIALLATGFLAKPG